RRPRDPRLDETRRPGDEQNKKYADRKGDRAPKDPRQHETHSLVTARVPRPCYATAQRRQTSIPHARGSKASRLSSSCPFATSGDEVWSSCGTTGLQPTATVGKGRCRESRLLTCEPLHTVASVCAQCYMVRRGSTVRVRQRALQKRRTSALSAPTATMAPPTP